MEKYTIKKGINNMTTTTTHTHTPSAHDYLKLHEQANGLRNMKGKLTKSLTSQVGDSAADGLVTNIEGLTVETVKGYTTEQINELYVDKNGEEIEVSLPVGNTARLDEIKKDLVIFLIESKAAQDEIDNALEKLEEEMKGFDEEFKKIMAEYSDFSEYMRTSLVKKIEKAEGAQKENLQAMLNSFDDSYTLANVIDNYTNLNTRNTLEDYGKRADLSYKRYNRTIKQLGLTFDITTFENLEKRYLAEKYHVKPNLFVFLIMKYGGHLRQPERTDGVFFSQLALNMKMLYNDTFGTEAKKKQFITSIETLLDLFI